MIIKNNESTAAKRRVPVYLVDSTDGYTPETGVTSPTIYVSKSGASPSSGSGSWSEIDSTNMPGWYYYQATQGECDTTGALMINVIKSGTSRHFPITIEIVDNIEKDTYDIVNNGTYGNSALKTEIDANETKIDTIDTVVDAIKTQTDKMGFDGSNNINSTPQTNVTVGTNNDKTGYSISGTKQTLDALNDLSASDVNTECDTALTDYDPPTKTEMDNGFAALNDLSKTDIAAAMKDQDVSGTGAVSGSIHTDIQDNIDANETKIDTVDTVVDAIQAKTDNLPADPASETNATSNKNDIITEVDANETKIDTIDTVVDAVQAKTDNLPADPTSETNATSNKNDIITEVDANETKIDTVDTVVDAIKTQTDKMGFDGSNNINSTPQTNVIVDTNNDKTGYSIDTNNDKTGYSISGTKQTLDALNDIDSAGVEAACEAGLADYDAATGTDISGLNNISKTDVAAALKDQDVSGTGAVSGSIHTDIQDNIDANETKIDTVDTVVDAIQAKTDNLPADPTSETNATSNKNDIITEIDANETKIDTIDTVVDAVQAKTDNLPADPTSETNATSNKNDIVTEVDANETKIDTIDTNVDAVLADTDEIQGKLPTNNIMGSSDTADHDTDIDWLKNVMEADVELDTTGTPWEIVFKTKDTSNELIRKKLYEYDDTAISTTAQVVGKQLESAV